MDRRESELRKPAQLLHNEDGVAIIAVTMILVMLTIIGIATTNVSNTEVTISGNQSVYQRTFYQAEGATIEAIDLLENMPDPDTSTESWLENDLGTITAADLQDAASWDNGWVNTGTSPAASTMTDTQYVVIAEGIIAGSSLGVTSAKVRQYAV